MSELSAVLCHPLDGRPVGLGVNGAGGAESYHPSLSEAVPSLWGVHLLKSLMVSRLTEEFQDEGFQWAELV